MSLLSRLNVSTKLAAVAGLVIGALLIAASAGLTAYTAGMVGDLTHRYADAAAGQASQEVLNELSAAGAGAKVLATTLGAAREAGVVDRRAYLSVIKPSVHATPTVMGAWFMSEPNAIGTDTDYRGDLSSGSNAAGRLSIYWIRQGEQVQYEPEIDGSDFKEAYYTQPIATGRPLLVEPYEETIAGKQVLMTSVAFPVRSGGRLIGVAGLDLTLSNLATRLGAMAPLGAGRVMLVSSEGRWVVHPDAAFLGKPYEGVGKEQLQAVLAGRSAKPIKNLATAWGHSERIIRPVRLPSTGQTWALVLDVPQAAIDGPTQSIALMMLVGGLVIIAAIVATLIWTSTSLIGAPLTSLTRTVARMGGGDYDSAVQGVDRTDEVGAIARALDGFRSELAQAQTNRRQQEVERHESEVERRRHAEAAAAHARAQGQAVAALAEGLAELAQGELVWRMSSERFEGDTAAIPVDFNAAISELELTMAGIQHTASSIRASCFEISQASDQLAVRTERQAASLEQTAAALDELTATVKKSADGAVRAADVARQAQSKASLGGKVMQDAIGAMQGIETSSAQINQITGVIDEIAFQTNLLALNAGVEAARAGDAGRGFAVVAMEVRALALRSAEAAKEIKVLIAESREQVERGSGLVAQSGRSLQEIIANVSEAHGLVSEIAAAAKEQALGISEVNIAVNQMDQMTQQNAAMVEESTAASHTLVREASELESLISRFKIGRDPSLKNVA